MAPRDYRQLSKARAARASFLAERQPASRDVLSLAEAIAAVGPFGTIFVDPGRYTGPGNGGIFTGKSFTLRGLRGADETVFDLEGAQPFLKLTGTVVVLAGIGSGLNCMVSEVIW